MEENKSSWLVPVAIVICILLIGGAVYYKDKVKPGNNATSTASSISPALSQILEPAKDVNMSVFRTVDATDKLRGSASAPIKVVVYTDLECPACKYFHQQLKLVEDKYVTSGKLAVVYRDFPLDALHPKARNEFLAAECVNSLGGNEKYWQFIDKIFEITPANNGLDPAKLDETAKSFGVDSKTFTACMSTKKFADKIQASVTEGEKLGVNGTPFFVIVTPDQSIPVFGGVPADRLSAAFDVLLGTAPATTEATASTTAQ